MHYKLHQHHLTSSALIYIKFLLAFLLLGQADQSLIAEGKIRIDIILDQNIIKESQDIALTYRITNIGDEDLSDISLYTEMDSYVRNDIQNFAENLPDEVLTVTLPPGAYYDIHSQENLIHQVGEAWLIKAAVQADAGGKLIVDADATFIYAFGINMEVNVAQECATTGEPLEISLITRLLIQEDAAKDPGTTTIIVGGVPIIINLPASQWEARDLILTATGINDGNNFDPFTYPDDGNFMLFCDQGNADMGRNSANILDECEPIETIRPPCTTVGENDDLCEFPDWISCYSYAIPSNYSEDSISIIASDNFQVWQALENPPASGMYDDFTNVTDQLESGNIDTVTLEVKVAAPVNLLNFGAKAKERHIALRWQTAQEINNSHFILEKSGDGLAFEEVALIDGQGTTTELTTYRFDDKFPFIGKNYYRLVQVDTDGTSTVSDIIIIEFDKIEFNSLVAYPNPAKNTLYVRPSFDGPNQKIEIHDMFGQLLFSNVLQDNHQIELDNFPNGNYLISLKDASGGIVDTQTFVIIK